MVARFSSSPISGEIPFFFRGHCGDRCKGAEVEALQGGPTAMTGRTRTQATTRKENLHIEHIASTPAGRDNGEQR